MRDVEVGLLPPEVLAKSVTKGGFRYNIYICLCSLLGKMINFDLYFF